MKEYLQKDPETWDLFTRKEEYQSMIRDRYDRFPYYASTSRNIFEPRVSKRLLEQGYHAEYPDGKPFAVCLTHDIDILYETNMNKSITALRQIKNANFYGCMHSLSQMRSKKLPWWNFYDILAIEEGFGAKSSFYLMVQDPGEEDYTYDIEDCQTMIGELSDEGWEVGLHGGHTTYTNPVEMKAKKQRLEKILNKKIFGYRNHYLRFRVPDTWEYLCSAGFHYDATFGYADCIGFRNGMCHPFKPYNLATQQVIDIIEIPLTVMDYTLGHYMKLDARKAWDTTKQLIDTVERFHGIFTLLWHNTSFHGEERKLYEKILKYCGVKGAWMTSGVEVMKWMEDGNLSRF